MSSAEMIDRRILRRVRLDRIEDADREGFDATTPEERIAAVERLRALLARPGQTLESSTPPSLTSASARWCRRVIVEIAGLDVPVIGRAELIRNKRAAGREKDRFDLDLLARYAPRRKR